MRATKPTRPTERETQLLRLLAQRGGRMIVTYSNGKARFTTGDGYEFPEDLARRWVKAGWVQAQDRPLFGDLAQSYALRSVIR